LLDPLEVRRLPYSQKRFTAVDPDTGQVFFHTNSATNVSPSQLPPALRDPDSPTPGMIPLTTLVAELGKDGRLRFGKDVKFDPQAGWIIGRYGAARFLQCSEKTVARTLEQDDSHWAPRVGRFRAYDPTSLAAFADSRALLITSVRQEAASLPRGAGASIRRCEKRWGILGESRGMTGNGE
jgi:hypothetical protein